MLKLGIITDKFHLEQKLSEFLKYLGKIADVSLYVEESYFLRSSSYKFEEDLFFVKGKRELTLAFIKQIEKETSIPVINSYKGIWNAINRFMNSMLLKKAGIPVPDFTLNPIGILPEFESYIIKNIIDQKNYRFKPKIVKSKNGQEKVSDERALSESIGGKENYQYLYYQKFVKSKWEYKIYIIGENIYFYKQIPILVNPNKMESRKKIDEIPELKVLAFKAVETIGLKIASIDFLKNKKDEFFLTDINCTPNFNYLKNGPKIVGDFLLAQAKK